MFRMVMRFWMVMAVFFLFALQTVFLTTSAFLTVLRLDALSVGTRILVVIHFTVRW
jgi:hypothetical protein